MKIISNAINAALALFAGTIFASASNGGLNELISNPAAFDWRQAGETIVEIGQPISELAAAIITGPAVDFAMGAAEAVAEQTGGVEIPASHRLK